MRILYFVLLVAAFLPSAYGHVRLYRTDTSGAVNNIAIRNAPSATSDGAFSVNGPCGGSLTWGKNGAKEVKAGDVIKMTIGYNGGHASAQNVFRASFACGKPDNDAALKASAATLQNVPTQAEPSSAVANRHTFTITLPANNANIANGDKCTISVLDQRDWGGCIDLQYPTAAAATTAAPGGTTTKAASTTTTRPPTTPAPQTDKLNGAYIIGLGCDSTAPGCCCVQGTVTAQLSQNKQTLTFNGANLRSNCPNAAQMSQTITTTLQTDGSYKATSFTMLGQPFSAEVILEKRQLIVTNNADDRPTVCSFTATKPPSLNDLATAATCARPTPTQTQACLASIPNLPACEAGRPADYDTTKCCVTCRPSILEPKPKCPFKDLPPCAAGVAPIISAVTGCPSCVQLQRTCPNPNKNVTACPPGLRPQRGADDCITCRAQPDNNCSPAARAECARKVANQELPVCDQGLDQTYVADFDVATCCRKCIPPATADKPADGFKCTPTEVAACMNKAPICEDGEKPDKDTTKCCPTCKRPNRDCKLSDVARCRANMTTCAAGEIPAIISGECCETCKPAPPVCTPACNKTTSICIRNASPGTTLAERLSAPGRCFPRRNVIARIDVSSLNGAVTEASVKGLILEIIERFCELPTMKNQCGATDIARLDLDVQIIAVTGTNAQVRIGFPAQVPTLASLIHLQRVRSQSSVDIATACWSDDVCIKNANVDTSEVITSAFMDASTLNEITISDIWVDSQQVTPAPTDAPPSTNIPDGDQTDPPGPVTNPGPVNPPRTSGASSTTVSFVSIVLPLFFIVRRRL